MIYCHVGKNFVNFTCRTKNLFNWMQITRMGGVMLRSCNVDLSYHIALIDLLEILVDHIKDVGEISYHVNDVVIWTDRLDKIDIGLIRGIQEIKNWPTLHNETWDLNIDWLCRSNGKFYIHKTISDSKHLVNLSEILRKL